MHLIDIMVERLAKRIWVTEEDAHRRFRLKLLNFWAGQGGRKKAIVGRGGAVTKNTMYLVHKILDARPDDSEVLVEWVGFGKSHHSWEPRSGICHRSFEMIDINSVVVAGQGSVGAWTYSLQTAEEETRMG